MHRRRLAGLLLAATVAIAHGFVPVQASDLRIERAVGPVVAIGGALRYDNDPVWSRLVALAGGDGARFVVLATAAARPEESAARVIETLQRHGASAAHVAVAPRIAGIDLKQAVSDPRWLERVEAATGVYFTGGEQERIVDTLQPGGRTTPLLEAIRGVHRRGGVIAGTSAGAAILSRTMFRDAIDVMAVMRGTLRDGKEVDRGLDFVGPDLFVDQHFLRRGRIGRMLPLLQSRGYAFGLGVEENSAAIIRGHEVEIIGPGGALFVDLSHAATDESLGAFNMHGGQLSFLGDGDRLDLHTRRMTPAAHKAAGVFIDPRAPDFRPEFPAAPFVLDVLGDGAIVRAMSNLLDSPLDEVRGLAFDARFAADDPQRALGFEFRLYKGPDTVGWYSGSQGDEAYSVAGVRLDVTPVRVAEPLYRPWTQPSARGTPKAAP
jgi:cyanophycinase